MKITILRKKRNDDRSFLQTYEYAPSVPGETAATALKAINRLYPDDPVSWDCGCLQKKCGACAMVINGRPGLACAFKLSNVKKELKLEPLRKFHVVEDLITDRSILQNDLIQAEEWLDETAVMTEKKQDILFEASRCLQCGCCLEVCPNYMPDGTFYGMAAAVPLIRLINESNGEDRKHHRKIYGKHIYNGCGKSLSCRNICPAGIDIDRLLVHR